MKSGKTQTRLSMDERRPIARAQDKDAPNDRSEREPGIGSEKDFPGLGFRAPGLGFRV